MKKLFAIDLRSLGFFRIFIGIILIFDFFNRYHLTPAFYSDSGIATRWDIIENFEVAWKTSLMYLNGSAEFSYFLATIGIIASFLFTVGFRTRLSAFVAWILLCSFQNRFPMVNHGGDNLLRLLLFFSIFIPVNARFSLDRFFGKTQSISEKTVNSSFSFLIFLQIFLMYFFTFFYKWHPSWFKSLDSLYFAMNIDLYTTEIGKALLGFPVFMKIISFLTLWIEGLGPLLLLIPWQIPFMRIVAFVIFWGLHIGILLTLHLGNFPWACLALWVPILPTEMWDWIESRRAKKELGFKLYYDYECGFCRKFSFYVKEMLFLKNLEVLPSDSDKVAQSKVETEHSWFMVANGDQYLRYDLFCKLLDSSVFRFLNIFYANPLAKLLGDYAYRKISVQRYKLGTLLNKFNSVEIRLTPSKLGTTFAIYLIILSTAWNFEGFLGSRKFDIRDPFTSSAFILGLNQQWNMFAPKPMTDDGWYVVDGKLRDGKTINPFTNSKVDFSRPKYPQDSVDGTQWRKFFVNLWNRKYNPYRLRFARYLCRSWNNTHENKLDEFVIYYMLERTPKDQTVRPKVQKKAIWTHYCFK